jgi:hypothetical protein
MSLADAEIPGTADGGNEALPSITKRNRELYLVVLLFLGIALILLIIGWIVITAVGKTVPDGLPVVIATIVGALVGAISVGKHDQ